MTRDELVLALKAIKRRLDARIVIVRTIVAADGRPLGALRRTVPLQKETKKK
jgi:hypothetical protein